MKIPYTHFQPQVSVKRHDKIHTTTCDGFSTKNGTKDGNVPRITEATRLNMRTWSEFASWQHLTNDAPYWWIHRQEEAMPARVISNYVPSCTENSSSFFSGRNVDHAGPWARYLVTRESPGTRTRERRIVSAKMRGEKLRGSELKTRKQERMCAGEKQSEDDSEQQCGRCRVRIM